MIASNLTELMKQSILFFEKDGNIIIDIHSSRFGKYSNNLRKIRKYLNPKLWKIRTYLSNAKDSYEYGNLIIGGELRSPLHH